jgi:hypothetical protein
MGRGGGPFRSELENYQLELVLTEPEHHHSSGQPSLVEPRGFKRLVDVSPLAPDGLSDIRGAHPFLAHGDDARVVESGRAAL